MTFIPKQQEKKCLLPCGLTTIENGLCDCINRHTNRELTTEEIESVNECPKCGCDFSVGYNGEHFECYEVDCKHTWTIDKKKK